MSAPKSVRVALLDSGIEDPMLKLNGAVAALLLLVEPKDSLIGAGTKKAKAIDFLTYEIAAAQEKIEAIMDELFKIDDA